MGPNILVGGWHVAMQLARRINVHVGYVQGITHTHLILQELSCIPFGTQCTQSLQWICSVFNIEPVGEAFLRPKFCHISEYFAIFNRNYGWKLVTTFFC